MSRYAVLLTDDPRKRPEFVDADRFDVDDFRVLRLYREETTPTPQWRMVAAFGNWYGVKEVEERLAAQLLTTTTTSSAGRLDIIHTASG